MRVGRVSGVLACCLTVASAPAALGHRVTFEVWPDGSADHVLSCSVALSDGWISLVRVRGPGMPAAQPMRWRASPAEVEALARSLQTLVGGELGATDPVTSRLPPAPFVTVTWMTQLDETLASGLLIQPGGTLPAPLRQTLAPLGIDRACGLSARSAG